MSKKQAIFDTASENATTMSSVARAYHIQRSPSKHIWNSIERMEESNTKSECVEFIKDKYARVFGKNTPSVAIKVYGFSNENVSEMFDHLDVNGKSVLVVGSSADQAIAAIMGGAKNIILADKNPITEYYSELKIAALKVLTQKEFEDFLLHKETSAYFSHKYYQKFSYLLNQEVRDFWDAMFMDYDGSEIGKSIFHANTPTKSFIPYLRSDAEYKRAQQLLQKHNVNYVIDDVLNFHKHVYKPDLIMLSNIIDYISGKNEKSFGEELAQLKSKLNVGGIIQYEYSWGPKEQFENQTALKIAERRVSSVRKYLHGGTFYELSLQGDYGLVPHKAVCYLKGKLNSKNSVLKIDNDKEM